MSEKAVSAGMVKKWDEVNGVTAEEPAGSVTEEIGDAGAGPSISRNYMRGIEDMVEQNDNSFDGVINNVEAQKPFGGQDAEDKEKQSVLGKLRESQTAGVPKQPPVHERKPSFSCCLEREVM